MKFIDEPRYVERAVYDAAIDSVLQQAEALPGTVAVFQIGGVGTPGISDIDLVVVFEDGTRCATDPLAMLPRAYRYLFVHRLYGAWRTDFETGQRTSLFHHYRLLQGETIEAGSEGLSGEDRSLLQRQIALEYLLSMYIHAVIERTYGYCKLRTLLLQVKALTYDLEFLGVQSGPLYDAVAQVVAWRASWFDQRPTDPALRAWHADFVDALTVFLAETLEDQPLYVPRKTRMQLARPIYVRPGASLAYTHSGRGAPRGLGLLGKKVFNLAHRFNQFDFVVPCRDERLPGVIAERFELQREMRRNNELTLPHFMPLASTPF